MIYAIVAIKLRICIYYDYIKAHDESFVKTGYLDKLAWLAKENETVFDPTCDDVIRVAFMHKFKRAKMADLVQLLTGRDFETREFKEEIADETFKMMYDGVLNVISQHHFTQFLITIKSLGFISNKMITSRMAIDFAFTLYLLLQESEEPVAERKRIVQKWYLLSTLTGRYTGSPESVFAKDLRLIHENGITATLKDMEDATLSDNFWNVALPQNLATTSVNNPTFIVFLASQVAKGDISMLSSNIAVRELIDLGGDVHHIFPRKYLMKNNIEKNMYNQVANYTYLDTPVNQSIGMKAPKDYFGEALAQCETKEIKCGSILEKQQLMTNLESNCIPSNIFDMDIKDYDRFLALRRERMAKKIRDFYEGL